MVIMVLSASVSSDSDIAGAPVYTQLHNFFKFSLESVIVPRYLYDWPFMTVTSWLWACFLKSVIISFVLDMFNWRYDSLHHFTKPSMIGPWLVSLFCSRLTITELSAYFTRVLFSYLLWRSVVYRMNNDSTHPCGEPVEEQSWPEKTRFTRTLCVLLGHPKSIQQTLSDTEGEFCFAFDKISTFNILISPDAQQRLVSIKLNTRRTFWI